MGQAHNLTLFWGGSFAVHLPVTLVAAWGSEQDNVMICQDEYSPPGTWQMILDILNLGNRTAFSPLWGPGS
jgi:hypothetical protein